MSAVDKAASLPRAPATRQSRRSIDVNSEAAAAAAAATAGVRRSDGETAVVAISRPARP